MAVEIDQSIVQYIPNNHPEVIGEKARMRFKIKNGQQKWFDGIIDGINQQYGVYFPCDKETVFTNLGLRIHE